MKIVTCLRKNGDPQQRVVDFHLERDTFRNKTKKNHGNRVMLHCSQDHQLLVPPVHAQPTVTASLRCSTAVIAMHRHVDHWARNEGLTKKGKQLDDRVCPHGISDATTVAETNSYLGQCLCTGPYLASSYVSATRMP